ncbi:hypothetical protein C8R46DRAFT_1173201 [Mycena filopes]|nr:hypothetical protein C8R46DRAFT_1173201 [Mycena filopes]
MIAPFVPSTVRSCLRARSRLISTAASRFDLPPTIRQILASPEVGETVAVTGWVKSIRKQKRIAFGVLSDGSSAVGLQAVFLEGLAERVKEINNGTSVRVRGSIVKSPGAGQEKELHVEEVEILGACPPETYPIQKQALTPEYLRDNTHLRARTDAISAMVRLRGLLMRKLDRYFERQDFAYAHTPVLTSGDAEGGGEAFRIRAPALLRRSGQQRPRRNAISSRVPAYLTVSHQLHLEALKRGVTRRHLAEFWMLEAEWGTAALCDFVEGVVKGVVGDSSIIHGQDVDQRRAALVSAVTSDAPWPKLSYSDAIRELLKSEQKWTFPVRWGSALQSEHEKWLCETLVGGPLFEGVTMGCFDLLMPHVGELAGGSVREERLDVLKASMESKGMILTANGMDGTASCGKFGGAPHVGFGLGFERLVGTVRECIPMPRWAGRMVL